VKQLFAKKRLILFDFVVIRLRISQKTKTSLKNRQTWKGRANTHRQRYSPSVRAGALERRAQIPPYVNIIRSCSLRHRALDSDVNDVPSTLRLYSQEFVHDAEGYPPRRGTSSDCMIHYQAGMSSSAMLKRTAPSSTSKSPGTRLIFRENNTVSAPSSTSRGARRRKNGSISPRR